jgi:hypothetical protein
MFEFFFSFALVSFQLFLITTVQGLADLCVGRDVLQANIHEISRWSHRNSQLAESHRNLQNFVFSQTDEFLMFID